MKVMVAAALCAGLLVPAAPALADTPDDPVSAKVLKLVNKQRSEPRMCGTRLRPAAKKLEYDRDLGRAAQDHAAAMAQFDFFDHASLDGRSPVDRIEASGYSGSPGGENIAFGQQTARQVVTEWMASPPHCRLIMVKAFDEIGLGLASRTDPQYSMPLTYWVLDFGIE